MSGVLERMVLRARSGLTGIEPLYRPSYAPVADAAQAPAEWSSGNEVAVEQSRAPAPSGRPAERPPASPPPVPADSDPMPRAATADASVDLPRAAPSAPRAREEIREPETHAVSLAAPVRPSPARPDPRAAPVASEPGAASLPAAAETDARPGRAAAVGSQLAPKLPSPTGGEPAPLEPVAGTGVPSLCAIAAKDAARHPPARAAAAPVATIEPAGRQPQQPAPPGPDAEVPRPPNVTISIGHIELRAAQVPERLRRPSFRPRLTLDDFLAGRPGAPR
jgi:hypothetical protein